MSSSPHIFEVTETLNGTHPKHTDYPLLPGDVLVAQPDGSFYKTAPGLGIMGFRLSSKQFATLVPRTHVGPLEFVEGGLAGYADYLASKNYSDSDSGSASS